MTRQELIEGILQRHQERLYTDRKYARKAHIVGAVTKGAAATGLGVLAYKANKKKVDSLLKDNTLFFGAGSAVLGLSALSNVRGAFKKDPRFERPRGERLSIGD